MKLPKMIGAHAPKKLTGRPRRDRLYESAALVNAAYDEWTKRSGRTHLVRNTTLMSPVR